MLVGDITPGIVGWTTTVTVNGIARAIRSVSWDTEMTGDLPDQVIASGGLGGASGTISWATQKPVDDRPVSPWHKPAGWPPTAGDVVVVRVSDGVTTWTRFTGVIDTSTGDPTSGFQSKIIDRRDQITGMFTHQALLRHMVPNVEDGAYRSVGLNFWYPLTSALRSAGFCNVPPVEAPSAMSAPMQGSVWPEAGNLVNAGSASTGRHAGFFATEFGYAAGDFNATYAPRLAEPSSSPVQITMVIPGTHSGVAVLDTYYGAGAAIRFRVNASGGVNAYYSPTSAGTWTSIATVGGGGSGVTTIVQLLIKDGVWTLRTSNGALGTGTQAMASGNMSQVILTADASARIAGVQISHPTGSAREFASLGFSPSMRFTPSGLASTMDMMPALKGRSVTDLVDEILSATLTASWWDETGTLILRPSDLLRSTAPSQTVTTAGDITALAWEDSLLAVRSAVEVGWKDPAISKGRQYRLELWRGATQTFINGADPIVDWIAPDSGVEWFGVDRAMRSLFGENWGVYNSRRGSFYGVWLSNASGDPTPWTGTINFTVENLYADSIKFTTAPVAVPAGLEVNTETHPEATALKPYLRGQSLPVVRGMGRGEWIDAMYRADAGPAHASVLSHDLGYWGGEYFEGGSVAQRIGDYLAGMVAAPHPTITQLGLVYDPRRQLGDVITISSGWLGIELRALIVRISESHEPGTDRQRVSVRIISATSTRPVTYDDLAAAWGTGNYAGLQAAWAALNYTALEANPLEGAPS